jgi:regulator of sirC expression with transglutaminase-like and TPR domain
MINFVHQFAQSLRDPDTAPERLALAIAGMAFPTLDMAVDLQEIDRLAAVMRQRLADMAPGRVRAVRFLDVLNRELGFIGNREEYYDPANSFLNVVLRQRMGLPIMLSLLCVAIGRRIDLDIVGVGFPGHFMARYQDEVGAWLLDPFNGEVVDYPDADGYLSRIFQRPVTLPADVYEAISAPALAHRILNNLRNVYLSRGDYVMAARVMEYLLVLAPLRADFWHERGLLYYYSQEWEKAAFDLKRYFFLTGQLLVALGHAPAGEPDHTTEDEQQHETIKIFRQIEETRQRIN